MLLVVISGAVVVASPSAAGTCCGTASDSVEEDSTPWRGGAKEELDG